MFLYDRTQNSDEDGYNIVKEYLDSDYMRTKTLRDKIGKSATSDLSKKRQEEDDSYALWKIVEVLSFGHFIDYTSYTIRNIRQKNISAVIFGH